MFDRLASAPTVTKGFWQACEDVGVDAAYVVAPVQTGWAMSDKVWVLPVTDIPARLQEWIGAAP